MSVMLEAPLSVQHRPGPHPQASHLLPDPFIFIPISKAEAAKGRGRAKRIVRAHVTRVQHAKASALTSRRYLQPWTVKAQSTPSLKTSSSSDDKSSTEESDSSESTSTAETALISIPALPGAKRVGAGRQDPFWSYPVEQQTYLPAIFAHYVENIAVDIPDIDGPGNRGLIRRKWFPLAMEEAATMYAVLLMAASHYCAVQPGSLNTKHLVDLKARALSAINAGLQDPKRATSDAMIGAVMKMAAYEAIFGDSTIFSTHMKGLSTMLKMRGGLTSLGLEGLLERMIVWIDFNAATICGFRPLFREDSLFPTSVYFPAPDLYHFAGIQ